MPEATDLLLALRDVGVDPPRDGDPGDIRVRAAVRRAADRMPGRRRRVRLPQGRRSIRLVPAVLLLTGVTAAAAGAYGLLNGSPTALFANNPQSSFHETVIRSTVRRIASFQVPGIGTVQYWVAATRQRGLCQAIRLPNSTWAVMGANLAASAGEVPGCAPTRKQQVIAQGNSSIGLLPMAVDQRSISLKNPHGDWFDVYYGVVDATHATAVHDPSNRRTAPLIDSRYFVMVVPRGQSRYGICMGCDSLRAINSAGKIVSANYGPERYRNH
jgi:hypothetical protein